jgi:hypothetical protein
VAAIVDAIGRFEAHVPFRPEVCRRNALRFTTEQFRREFIAVVERAVEMSRYDIVAPSVAKRWQSA